MADYLLTSDAAQDLQDIYRQGLERFGQTQADSYFNELFNIFDLLAKNPYMGTIFDIEAIPYHRYAHKAHILIYQVIRDNDKNLLIGEQVSVNASVKVLRVFYGKSDYFGQI